MLNSKYMDLTPPAMAAIKAGTPIAVIETGFFMQLAYPENVAALQNCEEAFWRRDCVPCCVAVVDGRIKVGLTKEDMEAVCRAKCSVSREELPAMVGSKGTAACTASAAVCVARMAGIVPVVCPGLGDSTSDMNALRNSRRLIFCNRLTRDMVNVYAMQGVTVLGSDVEPAAAADTYAVTRELEFEESTVVVCGPTLADLAEHTGGTAIALKKLNNYQ